MSVNPSTSEARKPYHAVRAMTNRRWETEQFHLAAYFRALKNLASDVEKPRDWDPSPASGAGARDRRRTGERGSGTCDSMARGACRVSSGPRWMSRVTPDAEAGVCEAALRAYLEQLVMRHIFPRVEGSFSALSLLSLCDEGPPRLSSSCKKIQLVMLHISSKTRQTLLGHAISNFGDPRLFSTMLNWPRSLEQLPHNLTL